MTNPSLDPRSGPVQPVPRGVPPTPVATALMYTIPETAKRMHVSQMTVRRLLARGELQRVQIGRAVRVLASSIEAFAAKGGAR